VQNGGKSVNTAVTSVKHRVHTLYTPLYTLYTPRYTLHADAPRAGRVHRRTDAEKKDAPAIE